MNSRKNLVPQGTSKQHIQFKTKEQKRTLFITKMVEIDALFMTKRLKNHTLWGRTYLYNPYKEVPPLGEIPGELLRVNMISSHVKISCYCHR